jgi:hypothetical protein
MKVGDLVKFKGEDENDVNSAKGLLVEMRVTIGGTHGVMWNFLNGQIGWQREHEIEVINESR